MQNYDKEYTPKTHWNVEYVCTTDGRRIIYVSTGLVRLGEKLLLNLLLLVLMDLNRRLDGRGSNRLCAGLDE